jgi:deoxyribose-phosphate aldolase
LNSKEIFKHVDHTILKACSTWQQVRLLCDEAVEHQMASVCIPPSFVKGVKNEYGEKLTVCTVIGFPLGYNTTKVKVFELKEAIADGADEVDMVINLGWVKEGNFKAAADEIAELKAAAGDKILKVIVETCYLTELEKETLCACVTEAKADFIKTSTGFGTAGATLKDIELFKKHIGPNVKIKASGGIRTYEDFAAYLNAGCERLGASSAIKVLSR